MLCWGGGGAVRSFGGGAKSCLLYTDKEREPSLGASKSMHRAGLHPFLGLPSALPKRSEHSRRGGGGGNSNEEEGELDGDEGSGGTKGERVFSFGGF